MKFCKKKIDYAVHSMIFAHSSLSSSPETFLKGMTMTKEPPSLPIHTLPPCLFNASPSSSKSFMYVLLYPILPSYN